MARKVDLVGKAFGRWEVINRSVRTDSRKNHYWECRCACGTSKTVSGRSLMTGTSISCGCYIQDKADRLEGTRAGKLLLLEREGTKWLCRCDCGNTKLVYTSSINSGNARSCGCSQFDTVTTHGLSATPEYDCWKGMLNRCENPDDSKYSYYGGRGIGVCDSWRGVEGLFRFIEDMGERPGGTSLDRIDPERGYCKENCRWATKAVQSHNRRGYGASEYKGVYFNSKGKICAQIRFNNAAIHLGIFKDEISAARAYDKKAEELYGSEASLNFKRGVLWTTVLD